MRVISRATIIHDVRNVIHDVRNVRPDVHLVAKIPDTSSAIGAERRQREKSGERRLGRVHNAGIAFFGSDIVAIAKTPAKHTSYNYNAVRHVENVTRYRDIYQPHPVW
jgi:hypothetical protein